MTHLHLIAAPHQGHADPHPQPAVEGKFLSFFNPRTDACTAPEQSAVAMYFAVSRMADESAALAEPASEKMAGQRMAGRDGSNAEDDGYPSRT